MGRGEWWGSVHRVRKNQTHLSNKHFHFHGIEGSYQDVNHNLILANAGILFIPPRNSRLFSCEF